MDKYNKLIVCYGKVDGRMKFGHTTAHATFTIGDSHGFDGTVVDAVRKTKGMYKAAVIYDVYSATNLDFTGI